MTVLPTSTSAQPSVFRAEVVIAGRKTKILIDQVRTIDVSYVAGDLVDYLSRDDMAQVEHSLSRYLDPLRRPGNSRHGRATMRACGISGRQLGVPCPPGRAACARSVRVVPTAPRLAHDHGMLTAY